MVLDAALRFLETRPRSVTEVRRRLATAGYRDDLVTAALDRLGALGILDDGSFARQWVESRDRARPRGERALQAELRHKGIDAETIERTLEVRRNDAGVSDPGAPSPDESGARRRLARSAAALARVADPRARRQKAYALLARSGFSSELASRLAREFTDETSDDD
ncbi:MAG: regulatory protein RecX [Candidatus Limnocylindrales bacterium]